MIADEALMAFVAWCRMNAWQYTSDPVLVRRVFDAYAGLPEYQSDGDGSMSEWAPWATKKTISGQAGQSFTGTARKITLHTTEGSGLPNYASGGGTPHFTVNPATSEAWQHIALNRSAYTLKSPGTPNSPNINAGVNIQFEIIGYAKNTPAYNDAWYSKLAFWVNWVCDDIGVPKSFFSQFVPNSSGSTRQSQSTWFPASGITGHQNVPGNDHWDPGGLDQAKLLHYMGVSTPPTTVAPPPQGPPQGGAVPPFPFHTGHWMGVASSDPKNHSGYYSADQPGIAQYQARLVERGWSLSVDGQFGSQSKSVTISYQQEKGLAADGLAGEQTWQSVWSAPVT